MAPVKIYRTNYCPYCDMAEKLFAKLGVEYDEVDVTTDDETRKELLDRTGMRTVPQIFIHGESVGGYDDVRALHSKGELLPKIENG